jgi:hypothetical protein
MRMGYPIIIELAERLGEDSASLREELADFSDRGIFSSKEKDVDVLLRLGSEASLFCDSAGVVYADVVVGGHRMTWPLASIEFKDWLTYRFYAETQKGSSESAIKTARQTLRARAKFEGRERHEVICVLLNTAVRFMSISAIRNGVLLRLMLMIGVLLIGRRCGSGARRRWARCLCPNGAVRSNSFASTSV